MRKQGTLGKAFMLGLLVTTGCGAEGDPDLISVGQNAQAAMSGDLYGQCSDILVGGLFNRYERNVDYQAAGLLKSWACSSNSGQSGGSMGANVMNIGIKADNFDSWKQANCNGNHDEFSSSFTYHALDLVADANIVNAWRDCMRNHAKGFFCVPEKQQDGVLRVAMSWDTVGPVYGLDLDWVTVHNFRPLGRVVNSIYEGTTRASFQMVDPEKIAVIDVLAIGRLDGQEYFQHSCAMTIGPKPPPAEPVQFFRLKSKDHGSCLDDSVTGQHGYVGNVHASPCIPGDRSQKWYWNGKTIRSAASHKCLAVHSLGRNNVHVAPCEEGSTAHQWYWYRDRMINVGTGLFLDISRSGTTGFPDNVYAGSYQSGDNTQKWYTRATMYY